MILLSILALAVDLSAYAGRRSIFLSCSNCAGYTVPLWLKQSDAVIIPADPKLTNSYPIVANCVFESEKILGCVFQNTDAAKVVMFSLDHKDGDVSFYDGYENTSDLAINQKLHTAFYGMSGSMHVSAGPAGVVKTCSCNVGDRATGN